ncbi:MAG: RidA family protein [Alphaproteobacteria bacterium]
MTPERRIDRRLEELGLALPAPMAPVASYVPFTQVGALIWISGQGPVENGEIKCAGTVGADIGLEAAVAAARLTALNLLAQLKAALDGDLDRVARVVKLGGFVRCTADFSQHPTVIDGASQVMVALFGEAGRHARFAVGAPCLPMRTAVEIDGIFEVRRG